MKTCQSQKKPSIQELAKSILERLLTPKQKAELDEMNRRPIKASEYTENNRRDWWITP